MVTTIIQAVYILVAPLISLDLAKRHRIFATISPVFLCYIFGMILAHQPWLPVDQDVSTNLAAAAIPFAIPLLLFSTDFRAWIQHSRSAAISFGLAVASIMIVTLVTSPFFIDRIPEGWKIAGMLVGIYTGGTANMASISAALDVNAETYILVQAAQILAVGVYMIFMISGAAQWLLLRFLPAFKADDDAPPAVPPSDTAETAAATDPSSWPIRGMGIGFLITLVFVGLSVGLSLLLTGDIGEVVVLLTVTSLGIAASFYKPIRDLPGTYALGDYSILMFCAAIGTLLRIDAFANADPTLLYFCLIVQMGAILMHYLLAYFFKLDADTVIITSAAGVFGPAFIGMVANALNNRRVLLSGLTTGLVGFAVGNYLGLAVAYLLGP